MDEPRRGSITGDMFLNFQEDEKGPYLIGEGRIRKGQYIVVVWFPSDIRQSNSYIMIFKKGPKPITQVAEWHDIPEEMSQVVEPLDKLLNYYSEGDRYSILLGIGRNKFGEYFLNEHLKPKGSHSFYYSICRDSTDGVTKNKDGILCDDADKLSLIEGLKEAINKGIIRPFPAERLNVLTAIRGDEGEYHIPEKDEAYIMALAGACRMFRDRPYVPHSDLDNRTKALAQEYRRPLFGNRR